MNRKLIYGGVVLAGLCLRGGWEACLKFAPNSPEQIYFVMGDRDCGLDSSVRDKYPNRMIFNDVNASILTLVMGEDIGENIILLNLGLKLELLNQMDNDNF